MSGSKRKKPTPVLNARFTRVSTGTDEIRDVNFDKTWDHDALRGLSAKMQDTANYIKGHRDKNNNRLALTQLAIAKGAGVSPRTVWSTLQALEDRDLIIRFRGYIMVNPEWAFSGTPKRREYLSRFYYAEKERQKPKSEAEN